MSNIVLVLELIIGFECMPSVPMTERDTRRNRATALNLHGLLAHWGEIAGETWITSLLGWEEQERARRSLERRLRTAHIGRFKPLCDFDRACPKRCDRAAPGLRRGRLSTR